MPVTEVAPEIGQCAEWNGVDWILKASPPLVDTEQPAHEPFARAGTVLKADEEERLIVSIAMVPELVDSQGDIASAEVIEKAAHFFLVGGGEIHLQHIDQAITGVHAVESYIVRRNTKIEDQSVKKGTWVMAVKVWNDSVWQAVKEGRFTGFSIGGFADFEEL